MITSKLNLQKLPGAVIHKNKDGKTFLVVPTEGTLFVGEKGTYLDLVHFETSNNEYGDTHVCVRSLSEERRKAGEKGEILGNSKVSGYANAQPQHQADGTTEVPPSLDATDDLPF